MLDACTYPKRFKFAWMPTNLMSLQFQTEVVRNISFTFPDNKQSRTYPIIERGCISHEYQFICWSGDGEDDLLKSSVSGSDQVTCCCPLRPLTEYSSGVINVECCWLHRDMALNAPMYERICLHVVCGSTLESVDILCELAVIVPFSHVHPMIVIFLGQMVVFFADIVKLFSSKR